MKQLQRLLPSDQRVNSLFIKLILGFFTIILLLVVFHFATISISTAKVRSEVIQYNTLQLEYTAEKYEQHFELLKRTMIPLLIDERVQEFAREPKYLYFPELQEKILGIVSNPVLFIRDIILYSDSHTPVVLSKSTSTNPDTMFRVFMKNEEYTPEFWKHQLSEPYRFQVLPAARFADHTFPTQTSVTPELFPIVFKPYESDPFFAIVFVDAERMFEQFHVSVDGNFAIVRGENPVFASPGMKELGPLPALHEEELVAEGHYVFRKAGVGTGFTYISNIPVAHIEGQAQLTATLLLILFISILASLSFAILFIRKIHNPLGEVLASLKELNSKRKTELLHYNYISVLKEILQPNAEGRLADAAELPNLPFSDKPYVLLLFDFTFRMRDGQTKETEKKWLLYMREIVERSLSLEFEEAYTIQIEKHQVLSLVFLQAGTELEPVLEKMKGTIDYDRSFGFATAAVSSVYDHSDHLTAAYEEAVKRLESRRFGDETEIVTQPMAERAYQGVSIELEQRFDLHLREGNGDFAVKALKKMLAEMKQRNSSVLEVESFVHVVTDKCLRLLSSLAVSEEEWQEMYARKQQASLCCTYEELEAFLKELIEQVCEQIQSAKEAKPNDPVIDFVVSYVEERYGQDVYLDELAEQLKMSSGYLSAYFKEKTGTNFIDYLHGIRIAKAQEMLRSTDLKIKDVAERIGYQNMNSFNRMFKKYTGVTPSDYRRNPALDQRQVLF